MLHLVTVSPPPTHTRQMMFGCGPLRLAVFVSDLSEELARYSNSISHAKCFEFCSSFAPSHSYRIVTYRIDGGYVMNSDFIHVD